MNGNMVLVGLGPHAKRIYISLIKKYNLPLNLVIDLKKNSDSIINYLKEENFNCDTYFLEDVEADNVELTTKVKRDLDILLVKKNIKYAIISTEPKAHFAYAKYFLDKNINILMDKPITAPTFVLSNIDNAKKIKGEYDILKEKYLQKNNLNFIIQCQRRFHKGYNYVKSLIEDTIEKYGIPITYLDVYHCDGMWNMPNEFFTRENHPYKYGYGKLFHSGYHFVDLITWLLESNKKLLNKQVNNAFISTSIFKPHDFFNTVDNDFYEKNLNTTRFSNILTNKESVKEFGELDFHAMIDFKKDDYIITHCNLNLLQSGFSKRAWLDLPTDTYKSNGRVRHERIDIQIGPIMNIQIHSYQAVEYNEKHLIENYDIGSSDHFDIYIFRNNNLIGGKPFEKISIKDLAGTNDFYGNNEKAREQCFLEFINNKKGRSDLLRHEESIFLLMKLCESVANGKNQISFKWGDNIE